MKVALVNPPFMQKSRISKEEKLFWKSLWDKRISNDKYKKNSIQIKNILKSNVRGEAEDYLTFELLEIPMWYTHLSPVLNSNNFDYSLKDLHKLSGLNLDEEEVKLNLGKESYDVYLVSSFTNNANFSKEIVNIIRKKEPQSIIVMGGPHVSYKDEETLRNGADFVVPCEDGETTIAFDKNKKNARYATSEDESFEKASSIGMYFIFDDFDKDSVLYTDRNMERKPIKFGTYGIGIQRCFHAILSQNIDEFGINFPKEVRPFDFSIMLLNPNSEKQKDLAERLYKESLKINLSPLLDDRIALIKDKAEYSDFIGAEYKVIIGEEEAKEENLTIKKRGEKIGEKMCIEKFIERYDK